AHRPPVPGAGGASGPAGQRAAAAGRGLPGAEPGLAGLVAAHRREAGTLAKAGKPHAFPGPASRILYASLPACETQPCHRVLGARLDVRPAGAAMKTTRRFLGAVA